MKKFIQTVIYFATCAFFLFTFFSFLWFKDYEYTDNYYENSYSGIVKKIKFGTKGVMYVEILDDSKEVELIPDNIFFPSFRNKLKIGDYLNKKKKSKDLVIIHDTKTMVFVLDHDKRKEGITFFEFWIEEIW